MTATSEDMPGAALDVPAVPSHAAGRRRCPHDDADRGVQRKEAVVAQTTPATRPATSPAAGPADR